MNTNDLPIDFLSEVLIQGRILSKNPCEEPDCEIGSVELVVDYKGKTYSVITDTHGDNIYQNYCQEI
jgi:hypothetical protein